MFVFIKLIVKRLRGADLPLIEKKNRYNSLTLACFEKEGEINRLSLVFNVEFS